MALKYFVCTNYVGEIRSLWQSNSSYYAQTVYLYFSVIFPNGAHAAKEVDANGKDRPCLTLRFCCIPNAV